MRPIPIVYKEYLQDKGNRVSTGFSVQHSGDAVAFSSSTTTFKGLSPHAKKVLYILMEFPGNANSNPPLESCYYLEISHTAPQSHSLPSPPRFTSHYCDLLQKKKKKKKSTTSDPCCPDAHWSMVCPVASP